MCIFLTSIVTSTGFLSVERPRQKRRTNEGERCRQNISQQDKWSSDCSPEWVACGVYINGLVISIGIECNSECQFYTLSLTICVTTSIRRSSTGVVVTYGRFPSASHFAFTPNKSAEP